MPSADTAERTRLEYYRSRLARYLEILRATLHLRYLVANALCRLLPDFVSGAIRARVYRLVGFDVGERAFIMGNLRLTGGSGAFYENLSIGADAMIAERVTINVDGPVRVGKAVGIGPDVIIYSASHRIGPGSKRLGRLDSLPVTIEDGAWIRLRAVIVPGVTIGRGSIVAAGAVVLHDVPPNTYVEGNPAKVIRKLGWANR
jgi:acetyltransferase-like isoleucine patch superfamily enzyme